MNKIKLASILTYTGGLPFLAGAALLVSGFTFEIEPTLITKAFITYGAIILSFLAGIHWGYAINSDSKASNALLLSSNFIALLAWACVLITSPFFTLGILFIGFIIQWCIDIALFRINLIPEWFMILRKRISIVVLICILMTQVAVLL